MNALGMFKSQKCRNARAHGIAHDMRLFDAEMIEQGRRVRRHLGRRIFIRIMGLRRKPMSAIIDGNDTISGFGQRPEPAGRNPVDQT
jgi:hypothetical protein